MTFSSNAHLASAIAGAYDVPDPLVVRRLSMRKDGSCALTPRKYSEDRTWGTLYREETTPLTQRRSGVVPNTKRRGDDGSS